MECKRAEPRDLKAIADCASTMMLPTTMGGGLGLLNGQFAGGALSMPGHLQAATAGAMPGYHHLTQSYQNQGILLTTTNTCLYVLSHTVKYQSH